MHGCVRERQCINTITCAATGTFWRSTESTCDWLNGRAAGWLRGLGRRGMRRRMTKAWQRKLGRWEERNRPERRGGAGIRGME